MEYKDVRSVLVLGDSVSKGVVLDADKKRYCFLKDGFLKQLTDQIRPEVFDCSKFGSTTEYGRKQLLQKLPALSPDLVLIEYGSNDCDYRWDEVAKRPHDTHLPNLSLSQYAANLAEMARMVREAGSLPVFTNLHPLVSLRYFNWFTKNDPARQRATLVWLGRVENIYWWQEMYSFELERTARALDVPVVNLRGAFLRQQDFSLLMCEDGIHPNERGHALIRDVFLDAIGRIAPSFLR